MESVNIQTATPGGSWESVCLTRSLGNSDAQTSLGTMGMVWTKTYIHVSEIRTKDHLYQSHLHVWDVHIRTWKIILRKGMWGPLQLNWTRVQFFTVLEARYYWIWQHFHVYQSFYPQFFWQFLNLGQGQFPSGRPPNVIALFAHSIFSLLFPHPRISDLSLWLEKLADVNSCSSKSFILGSLSKIKFFFFL